ncbi:MAG TPA: hypothetical protein VEZ90_17050 [Blastocatellia bacterium]|nr:hypothetical protein [Blastocatellia bacterium]
MTGIPLTHKTPNNLLRGLLLFAACALITSVGWASSGRRSEYAANQPEKLQLPKLPADMEERIRNAVNAPPLTVGQLSDPLISDKLDGAGSAAPAIPKVAKPFVPSFAERYDEWRRSVFAARQGGRPDPPVTGVYLAEELQPIGVVRAHGRTEVLFRVAPEKRDIPAPIGTRFYDCMLEAIEDTGVRITAGAHYRILEWASAAGPAALSASSPAAKKSSPASTDPIEQLRNAAPEQSGRPRSVTPTETKRPEASLSARPSPLLTPELLSRAPWSLSLASYTESRPVLVPSYAVYHPSAYSAWDVQVLRVSDHSATDGDARPKLPKKKDDHAATDSQPAPTPDNTRPRVATRSGESKDDARLQTNSQTPTSAGFPGPGIPEPEAERVKAESFCDPRYEGPLASIDTTRPTTLVTLTELYYKAFGVNFLVDPDIQELPIRASINDAPWTAIMRNIIEVNDLVASCSGNIITIMGRGKYDKLASEKRKSQPIKQKVFTLRYLQPNPSSIRSITGQQVPENLGLQSLEESIRKIVKASGDDRGDVTRVPGRNELIVAGTDEQLAQVTALIDRVDRPTYQVEVHAMVYSLDKNYLRDVGSQLGILAANGSQSNLGGVSNLPNNGASGSGQSSTKGGVQPGGIPGLATGLPQPAGALAAANAATILGYTAIVGTSQFSQFITLAQQKGWAKVINKPFGTVADGSPLELSAGSDIPVVTSTIAGGATVQTGNVQVLQAGKVLQITPQVAQDKDGKPTGVTLTVRIESNSVDTSLPAFGGLPSIARQSLQTVIRLTDGQTGVIGGLTADSTSRTVNSVPLVSNVPILGHLFKRNTQNDNNNRLYFALEARIIPIGGSLNNVAVPGDATTEIPPAESDKKEMSKKNEH